MKSHLNAHSAAKRGPRLETATDTKKEGLVCRLEEGIQSRVNNQAASEANRIPGGGGSTRDIL